MKSLSLIQHSTNISSTEEYNNTMKTYFNQIIPLSLLPSQINKGKKIIWKIKNSPISQEKTDLKMKENKVKQNFDFSKTPQINQTVNSAREATSKYLNYFYKQRNNKEIMEN